MYYYENTYISSTEETFYSFSRIFEARSSEILENLEVMFSCMDLSYQRSVFKWIQHTLSIGWQ